MCRSLPPGLRIAVPALVAALALGLTGGAAVAAPSSASGGAEGTPVLKCSALAGADFSHVPDAPPPRQRQRSCSPR
jgi:hypothetical protein